MQSEFETQQNNLISDHNIQTSNLTTQYEEKLGDLAQQKDAVREQMRLEMQAKIDDLLRQIEDEK